MGSVAEKRYPRSVYPGWSCQLGRGSSEICHEIGRAFDAGGATVENVGVDLRGADVTVSQELLDGADIVARLEQVRREGVAKGVRACALGDPGEPHGILTAPCRTDSWRWWRRCCPVLWWT